MEKPDNLSAMDFFRFNIRAGTIRTIEAVPKSKKLLKLEVDFGPAGSRTILAGLAPRLESLDSSGPGTYMVEGQRVVAIINLEPRTMMGLESKGMLLASADESGTIWLVNPGPVPDGAEVG
jgi:methionine--tRNA ligase beta chain